MNAGEKLKDYSVSFKLRTKFGGFVSQELIKCILSFVQDDLIKIGTNHLSKFSEPRDDCRLIGAWRTVIGHNEEFVHLWQYKDGYQSLDSLGGDLQPAHDKVEFFEMNALPT